MAEKNTAFHETIDEEKFNAAVALMIVGASEAAGKLLYEAGCRAWRGGRLTEWWRRTKFGPKAFDEQRDFWGPIRRAFEAAGGLGWVPDQDPFK